MANSILIGIVDKVHIGETNSTITMHVDGAPSTQEVITAPKTKFIGTSLNKLDKGEKIEVIIDDKTGVAKVIALASKMSDMGGGGPGKTHMGGPGGMGSDKMGGGPGKDMGMGGPGKDKKHMSPPDMGKKHMGMGGPGGMGSDKMGGGPGKDMGHPPSKMHPKMMQGQSSDDGMLMMKSESHGSFKGKAMIGQIASGSGETYTMTLYPKGLSHSAITASVKQLQDNGTLSAGTWAIVVKLKDGYYMQGSN